MVPPLTLMSSAVKSSDGSDNVNVMVAVSPAFKALSLDVIVMPGTTVSIVSSNELEVFALPAASVKLDVSTLIDPLAVLSSAGVNVAV